MSIPFPITFKTKDPLGELVLVLSSVWTIVSGIIVSIGFIYFPEIWERWLLFLLGAILIFIISFFSVRMGKVKAASWIFCSLIWLYITIPCYSAGGIAAPGILSQTSVLLTCAILLGLRGGLLFGILTIAVDFYFAYTESIGLLPQLGVTHNPITRWIGAIIPFGTILVLQYYATFSLRSYLKILKKEITRREEIEEEKDQTLYNLGERVKELNTLYKIGFLLQDEGLKPNELFQQIVELIPSGWQYPKSTIAKLRIEDKLFVSQSNVKEYDRIVKEALTNKGTRISLEVVYLDEFEPRDEGPFLTEERFLLDMLVELLKNYFDRKERETELKDYKYALDVATAVSISDTNGNFLFVNDNFANYAGYETHELIGKHHSILWSGQHDERYFIELQKGMEGGKHFRGEFCNKKRDGSFFWVETSIIPFVNDDGEVYQYLSINKDISVRKKIEEKLLESEEKFRSIVEHNLIGIFIAQENQIIYSNPGFKKIFGDENNDDFFLNNLFVLDDSELFNGPVELNTESIDLKPKLLKVKTKNNEQIHVELVVSQINYNGKQARIGSLLDVSERIKEERRISRAVINAQEKERVQIGMELHDNVKQILVSSGLFLNVAMRDIQEESINGVLRTVQECNAKAMDELRRLSHQLAPTLNEDSSIDQKIKWLISNLQLDSKFTVHSKLQELHLDFNQSVMLNVFRITQETLQNVIAHSRAKSIEISLENQHNNIHLHIKDDGIGFDQNLKKTGIGLENIRRRVQMIGGNLQVTSSPGNGTEVHVIIPADVALAD